MYIIQIENLTHRFADGTMGLARIDLCVKDGEFEVVCGPNGSGKSTLLKLVSNTLQPDKGSIFLDGRPLKDFSRKHIARRMAVVPQETDLGFDFTVREIVAMGRYPHLRRFQFNDPASSRVVDVSFVLLNNPQSSTK